MKVAFGMHVVVRAMSMRVVGYREGDVQHFKIPQAADAGPQGNPWFPPRTQGTWPGEPIPVEWEEPRGPRFTLEPTLNGEAMVRWRRHPLTPAQTGVVIGGDVWRYEGTLLPDGMVGPKRMLWFYRVALQPASRREIVAFVHERDLAPVLGDPVEDHDHALSGSKGRLGGAMRHDGGHA